MSEGMVGTHSVVEMAHAGGNPRAVVVHLRSGTNGVAGEGGRVCVCVGVRERERKRRDGDKTKIVWGTDTDACDNSQQEHRSW